MKQMRLSKPGIEIPALGYGIMRMPGGMRTLDFAESEKLMLRAHELGINYFDTAWIYHKGDSELLCGEVLSKLPRDSYYLATKLPIWDPGCVDYTFMERLIDEQLRKCKVSYFDFYLLHSMGSGNTESAEKAHAYKFLDAIKRQGKARFVGFSFHGSPEEFTYALNAYDWDFVQIQFNFLDVRLQNAMALYDILAERNIPCFVMEGLRGGFLTSSMPQDAVSILRAENPKMSLAEWAFRYHFSFPNIKMVLSGMSSIRQIEENAKIFSEYKPLSDSQQRAVKAACEKILEIQTVPCTACRYCMDCSFGVDIPKIFEIYNKYLVQMNTEDARIAYFETLTDKKNGKACTLCGACAPKCPQSIKIPETLLEIDRTFTSMTR